MRKLSAYSHLLNFVAKKSAKKIEDDSEDMKAEDEEDKDEKAEDENDKDKSAEEKDDKEEKAEEDNSGAPTEKPKPKGKTDDDEDDDGKKKAVIESERARMREIFMSPHAAGRVDKAIYFGIETDLTAAQVIQVLASSELSAPKAVHPTVAARMVTAKKVDISDNAPPATGSDPHKALADSVINSLKKVRGEK